MALINAQNRFGIRSVSRSAGRQEARVSVSNLVNGSPAIIHGSIRWILTQNEPLVRGEVQREQRVDLQRHQRHAQQQQRQQRESRAGRCELAKQDFMTQEFLYKTLLDTMFASRANKRYGKDSIDFEVAWVPKLMRMIREVDDREFRVDENFAFLTSVPRWREIFATLAEGRIGDHLLCDTLSPYVERELHDAARAGIPGDEHQKRTLAFIRQDLRPLHGTCR